MGTRQGAWVVGILVMGLAAGLGAAQMPEPLAAAVMLLGWSGPDLPRIEIVDGIPTDGTATAEAWVRFDTNGRAIPVIYVRSDTEVYHDALGNEYQALVRLAGLLAHERWHLRHGLDEVGAYTAQLSAMEYLHANAVRMDAVRRDLSHVSSRQKN
jgi:hypothetical protein